MRKILLQLASNIPAALFGGGMFIVSLFFLQLNFGLSFFVALSSYVIGGIWIFPPPNHAAVAGDNASQTRAPGDF